MRSFGAVAVIVGAALLTQVSATSAQEVKPQPPAGVGAPAGTPPEAEAMSVVKMRGTVDAIDKEKSTVTLKGPRGRTVTLDVKDKQKLDAIHVGDPVVASYMEAVVVKVAKAGTATPAVKVQESRVTSKPGETPAGAIGRQVSVTAAIVGINNKAHTVTIKGPQGATETIKARDPKNLEAIKVGDMVDITYTQALAVSLDKRARHGGGAR